MTTDTGIRLPTSLSVRLVTAATLWIVAMFAIGGAVLAIAFRNVVEQEFAHRLDAMLNALIATTEISGDGTVAVVRPLGDIRFEQVFSGWYWQVTEPGGRQVRSRSLWDSVITSIGSGTDLHSRRIAGPNGEPLLVVERDAAFANAKGPVQFLVAGALHEVNDGVRRFDFLLIGSLGLMGIGMALAILIQVRYGLRPLRVLAEDLRAVREGERQRLSGRYPREIAPLASAMNDVLDKDVELIERARSHVGNLAHGLKTSLAIVSAELPSVAEREVLTEQVQVMRRLIEHHLGRASAVAGAGRMLGNKVSVKDTAAGVAGVLTKIFADRDLAIEIDVAENITFHGHREDLEEIVGNLLENACKWGKGHVRISAQESSAGLMLCIDDDGPGMTTEQTATAARRGKRLDEMAPGWGLGLSIVADLVDVNGGTLTFGRSTLGGLSVAICFPLPFPRARD